MATLFPVSIASAYFRAFSPEDALTKLSRAGFSHAELAHEHVTDLLLRAEKTGVSPTEVGMGLRAHLADLNFTVNQGHLTFSQAILDEGSLAMWKNQLELFYGIGIQYAVLHLRFRSEEESEDPRAVARLRELVSFAQERGICICLENLFSSRRAACSEGLMRFVDEIDSEFLGICLDTGHLHLACAMGLASESQEEFIRRAGKHLKALHIANNDGSRDQHLLPYNVGKSIRWDRVIHALVDLGYRGSFNLEIGGEHSSLNCPLEVKELKLDYIKKLTDYLLSERFLAWRGNDSDPTSL